MQYTLQTTSQNTPQENPQKPMQTALQTHITHALKICKHEFLGSKILLILVSIIMFLNLCIYFSNQDQIAFYAFISVQSFAYLICSIVYILSAATSFYHGIFGRHAYLTHSLPVRIETIIIAKILIYFLWSLLIFATYLIMLYCMMKDKISLEEIWYQADLRSIWYFTWFLIPTILQEIAYIFMIVALVHKRKTAMFLIGILAYFGIKAVLLFCTVLLLDFIDDWLLEFQTETLLLIYSAATLFLFFVFYFICHHIVKYKLAL